MRQLRELLKQLILGRAAGQIPEDIPDRDASPPDAGLPEPDGGIDADAIEQAHVRKFKAGETKTAKADATSAQRFRLTSGAARPLSPR